MTANSGLPPKESKLFSDPQSVTVSTVAKSLPRVTPTSMNSTRYAMATGDYVLTISHTVGRRNQRKVRLDASKIVTDPLASDRNLPVSYSTYLVLDCPPVGFTNGELAAGLIALADWIKTSTNADRFVGGES